MWGSQNELLIFPLIELIKKEVQSMVRKGEIVIDNIHSLNQGGGGSNLYVSRDSEGKLVIHANLLQRLESNDFELELMKDHPDFPNMLTSVVVKFGEELHQIISLVRQGGKLRSVNISVVIREQIATNLVNPMGMSNNDFTTYTLNKKLWGHYNEIAANPDSSTEDKENANLKKTYYTTQNQQLRNVYGILDEADKSYDELKDYLPNPLGMQVVDFVTYCKNTRKYNHPESTEADKLEAHESNKELRLKYNIPEDDYGAFTYSDLEPYLPNPLGMLSVDFISFIENMREIETLDDSDPAQANRKQSLISVNEGLLEENYTSNPHSLAQLEQYTESNNVEYEEKALLRILVSLIYNSEDKLTKVKSETLRGDV